MNTSRVRHQHDTRYGIKVVRPLPLTRDKPGYTLSNGCNLADQLGLGTLLRRADLPRRINGSN
jgi:hypothetical protein